MTLADYYVVFLEIIPFSLLYYYLLSLCICAYISHGYFYQYNFVLGILSYFSFFHIFYFMYILFKCRTN